MTDKELLLKDLCARLPYKVKVECTFIPENNGYMCEMSTHSIGLISNNEWSVKPYLRPMSSMTEEERLYFHRNSARVQILVDEEKVITKPFYGYTIHLFDWLNSHHFDYRGLIEKDLAIEAPKDMYN